MKNFFGNKSVVIAMAGFMIATQANAETVCNAINPQTGQVVFHVTVQKGSQISPTEQSAMVIVTGPKMYQLFQTKFVTEDFTTRCENTLRSTGMLGAHANIQFSHPHFNSCGPVNKDYAFLNLNSAGQTVSYPLQCTTSSAPSLAAAQCHVPPQANCSVSPKRLCCDCTSGHLSCS